MSKKSIILLCFQFVAMAFLASGLTLSNQVFIIFLQGIGVLISVWAIIAGGLTKFNVQPEVKSQVLITKGPFALIRNPMYLGVLIFFGVDVMANTSYLRWLAFVILTVTLLLKIYSEERFLKEKFSDDYTRYQTHTYRLIPWIY